ncbi:MAG: PucR family transcriptional regulator, partial [Turicibacter sp.]
QIELYAYTYPNQFTLLVSERLFNTVETMKHVLIQEYEKALHCGVGEIKSLFDMSDSYQSALIALKYAKQTNSVYLNFKNLDFQLIAEELSVETKRRYIEKMIGELDEEDIEFLKHYYTCNLSLKECAESMFIHKNTVQYRLDKIYRKTGLNPRVFKESALIYLAISLKSDTGMSLVTKNK